MSKFRTKHLFSGCVAAVFSGVVSEVQKAISQCKQNPDDFIVSVYPFSIERKDKKPVDRKILETLRNSFSK